MKTFLSATADIVLQTKHATIPTETLPFTSATFWFYRKKLRFIFALGFYENDIMTNRQTLLINTELLRLSIYLEIRAMLRFSSMLFSQSWFVVNGNVIIHFKITVIQLFNCKYYLLFTWT
jgi:hypothetical protein